ncbi:MAG TPA: hypothetical protein VKI18_04825 [Albitalea sp.]|nr:hypothetical protein [Albitalea sp.]
MGGGIGISGAGTEERRELAPSPGNAIVGMPKTAPDIGSTGAGVGAATMTGAATGAGCAARAMSTALAGVVRGATRGALCAGAVGVAFAGAPRGSIAATVGRDNSRTLIRCARAPSSAGLFQQP